MLICRRPRVFDVDLYGAAAVVLMVAGTWLLALRPLQARLAQARQADRQWQENSAARQAELTRLQEAGARRRALAESLRRTRDVLEESTGVAGLVRGLGQLSEPCGLRLEAVTPGDKQTAERYNKVAVEARLRGGFREMRVLLARLNRELPFVGVRSLSVRTAGQDRSGGCEIILGLDVFEPR